MRAEVEETGAVAADLGPDAPDVVLVEVEEVEAGGVLEDRPGVVVAPQEVVAHLVSLWKRVGERCGRGCVITRIPHTWCSLAGPVEPSRRWRQGQLCLTSSGKHRTRGSPENPGRQAQCAT